MSFANQSVVVDVSLFPVQPVNAYVITASARFVPLCFHFPCQYATLRNLFVLVFVLTTFVSLCCITFTTISYDFIVFYLRRLFQERKEGLK